MMVGRLLSYWEGNFSGANCTHQKATDFSPPKKIRRQSRIVKVTQSTKLPPSRAWLARKPAGCWFPVYGCFLKWWYPQIIHFNRVFHYKPSSFGYHYFRKPPYECRTVHVGNGWKSSCSIHFKLVVWGSRCIPPGKLSWLARKVRPWMSRCISYWKWWILQSVMLSFPGV